MNLIWQLFPKTTSSICEFSIKTYIRKQRRRLISIIAFNTDLFWLWCSQPLFIWYVCICTFPPPIFKLVSPYPRTRLTGMDIIPKNYGPKFRLRSDPLRHNDFIPMHSRAKNSLETEKFSFASECKWILN